MCTVPLLVHLPCTPICNAWIDGWMDCPYGHSLSPHHLKLITGPMQHILKSCLVQNLSLKKVEGVQCPTEQHFWVMTHQLRNQGSKLHKLHTCYWSATYKAGPYIIQSECAISFKVFKNIMLTINSMCIQLCRLLYNLVFGWPMWKCTMRLLRLLSKGFGL